MAGLVNDEKNNTVLTRSKHGAKVKFQTISEHSTQGRPVRVRHDA